MSDVTDIDAQHRYLAAVAGWSMHGDVKDGPSGTSAIVALLDEDSNRIENEWSLHRCVGRRYGVQKEGERFFWDMLRVSRSSVVNKYGKKIWRTPLTWITDGDKNPFWLRARRLAERAALHPLSFSNTLLVTPCPEADHEHYALTITTCGNDSILSTGCAIVLARNGRKATWQCHRCDGDEAALLADAEAFAARSVRPEVEVRRTDAFRSHALEMATVAAYMPLSVANIQASKRVVT